APPEEAKAKDEQAKPAVMKTAMALLEERYDLRDAPAPGVTMSGGKPLQQGVRVKLPSGVTWDQLAQLSAEEIRQRGIFPKGFMPLPHVKHETGGQVFPQDQIDAMRKLEARDLQRF